MQADNGCGRRRRAKNTRRSAARRAASARTAAAAWAAAAALAASALAASALAVGCAPAPNKDQIDPDESAELASRHVHGVGVQLFQWPFTSVGRECEDFLGPAGYNWVLLSPAQEHITGEQWWTSYQPVSYDLTSRLGDREELEQAIAQCEAAGVKVYADAVINHMAGVDEGVGTGETAFTHYSYPGLWKEANFHHCPTPDGDIHDWSNASEVRRCELVNLADLRTEDRPVRDRLTAYLEDLTSLGIAGFRIDAAKHMAPADIHAITDPLPAGIAIAQEVIRGVGEPITPEEYLENGPVFEFSWTRNMAGVVAGGSWGPWLDLNEAAEGDPADTPPSYVPSSEALIFVANHDTERDGRSLAWTDGAAYELANALMLTGSYGQPMVYSGYRFSERDAGPPMDSHGRNVPVECPQDPDGLVASDPLNGPDAPALYTCEHRRTLTTSALALRTWLVHAAGNAARAAKQFPVNSVKVDYLDSEDVLSFQRGEAAFVVINRSEDEPYAADFQVSLPDGEYCSIAIVDKDNPGACQMVKVNGGKVSAEVAPGSAFFVWPLAER